MSGSSTLAFARGVVKDFFADDAMSLSAAVAFYTALSFAPLVLLLVTLGGFLGDSTQNELVSLFSQQLGPTAGDVTKAVVEAAEAEQEAEERTGGMGNVWRWTFGIVIMLVTASGVFAQLQASLNRVWDVVPKPTPGWRGWWLWIRKRLLSMGMVVTVLFILLASLVVSTVVQQFVPGLGASGEATEAGMAARAIVFVVSFLVAMLIFAAMFKFLPDIKLPWKDVWLGALITTALFTAGKWVLSVYLTKGGVGEDYGQAAGGLIALLVWVYYSCLAVLLGAEATQAVSRRRGTDVRPAEHAEWAEDAAAEGDSARPAVARARGGKAETPGTEPPLPDRGRLT